MNPKLRPDVQFFSMGNALYHVYDAATGRHYKMGEQEVGWLKLLDGGRTTEEYRGEIPQEYFEQFFAKAAQLGLLDGTAVKARRDLFKLKAGTLDPRPLLDKIGEGAVLYRRILFGTFPLLLALNVCLLFASWPLMRHSLESFHFNAWVVPLYLAAILFCGLVHESSHALVAKSHGVAVPAIGFMLMYFHPAFYADVSGINLLKSNRAKIGVLLAGIMSNNLLVSVALLIYPLVALASFAAATCMAYFILMNAILILMNLIPFIEYDGHYILLALFDDPNFAVNAWRSLRGRAPRRFEYTAYLGLYQIVTVTTVFLGLLRLRRWVLPLANAAIVNYVCLLLMVLSFVVLARRSARKMA